MSVCVYFYIYIERYFDRQSCIYVYVFVNTGIHLIHAYSPLFHSMCIHVHVCPYACFFVSIFVCISIYINTLPFAHHIRSLPTYRAYICASVRVFSVHIHARMYNYFSVCIYKFTYTYSHTYVIYIHTFVHVCLYTHSNVGLRN